MDLTYLASPYTHPDPVYREWRFAKACQAAAKLMLEGETVFCPIAHSHPIAVLMPEGMDIDPKFWKRQDEPYVHFCTRLAVLKLPGWENSKGIVHELAEAQVAGKAIRFLDPDVYCPGWREELDRYTEGARS